MPLVAVVLAALLAQDKVRIEVRAAAGDRYVHSSRETNEGTIWVTFGGMEVPQPMKEHEVRAYRDEVLEIQGAVPSKVRRETREWWEEKTAPGAAEPEKRVRALQGKTLVLGRKDGKPTFEGGDGIPQAELWKNRLRTDLALQALPKEPVAVGDTWPVDEKTLLQDFREEAEAKEGPPIQKAQATGKLEKIETHKGARCAVVLLSIEASGHLPQQAAVKLEMTMTARLWIDLDKARPLTMKGDGVAKIAGEIVQGDQKVSMKGEVKLSKEAEQVYE
jgi:hypothetical protein